MRFVLQSVLVLACGFLSNGIQAGTADRPDSLAGYILTPKAPDTPRINGPKITGVRPGSDFLFRIPATGVRPMAFSTDGLPKGLRLDRTTGLITGKVRKEGVYTVTLAAENGLGRDERSLRIVVGDRIALTPPMGWNSWNCWGHTVSQEKIMAAAVAMEEKGLADYGWSYVNIDDGWQGTRGGKYNGIQPNRKFPDMKGLADSLHAMGFKIGIYSAPWTATFAGHIGSQCDREDGVYSWIEDGKHNPDFRLSDPEGKLRGRDLWYHGVYSFAENDARQWADWGIDYLKYDWRPNDYYNTKEMHDALRSTGRDIVLSLSNTAPLANAPVWVEYADCWRTTTDIYDNWESVRSIGFEGQNVWAQYKGPGHWPDADMLVVGVVGWGKKMHPSGLTPDEQYTHITLWAMLASPLLIGCDLDRLDDFTLNLLCNNEVIDVNQDPLGYQASAVSSTDTSAVYVKPLEDGSLAVALFNLSDKPVKMGFSCTDFGITGDQTVRDIWRQKDLCTVADTERWETEVPVHGTAFLRIYPGNTRERPVGYKYM